MSYSIKLFLRKERINAQKLSPIYARLIAEKKIEIATTMCVSAKDWNAKTQRLKSDAKDAETINIFLDSFCSKVLDAYAKTFIDGKPLTAEDLRERIFGRVEKERGIMEIVEEHNKQFESKVGLDYSYGSYKNYKTTKKYLEEFIKAQYKKNDIPVSEVGYAFCSHYYRFLTSIKTCHTNGANKHIQRLKKMVNYALKMGYTKTNTLASFSLQFKPFHQSKLSWEEIKLLRDLMLQNKVLEKVRDVFVFQIFTGLAFADVKKLALKDIVKGNDSCNWISMQRTKTQRTFMVPLLQPAQILVDKYATDNYEQPLFPVLSNQKMNNYLKVLGEVAAISKPLSTHVARHTFATTIALQEGVPLETVSKMMGHTKVQTTQLYAVVTQQKIGRDMARLIQNFRE